MFRPFAAGLTTCAIGLTIGIASAQAALTIDAVVGGGPTEGSFINFDDLLLGPAGGTSGGVLVAFTGDAQAVKSFSIGQYAAPYLSNSNGSSFGDPSNGADTTTYLSTGVGTIRLTLPGPENNLGLLWGSVDIYNTLDLYHGVTPIGSVTGSNVTASADGDQGKNGTYYVNITSSQAFDIIVAHSSQYAFEFDNLAVDDPMSVPEPAAIAVFGIGLVVLGFTSRRPA